MVLRNPNISEFNALKEEVKKLRDQLFLLKDKVETHEKSENAHNKYRAWG